MAQTDDLQSARDPGPDRRDNVASAGLDPDTWVELENWRVDRGLSRSEGTRRLLRAGLEAETDDGLTARALAGFGLGLLTVGAALLGASGQLRVATYLGIAIAIGVIADPWINTASAYLRDRINL